MFKLKELIEFRQNELAKLISQEHGKTFAATRRLVHIGGNINKFFTFIGTFIFFSMLALSFTQSNPTHSEVFLFTFYQAGIIGGALFEMNKLTRHYNNWEDYQNGY